MMEIQRISKNYRDLFRRMGLFSFFIDSFILVLIGHNKNPVLLRTFESIRDFESFGLFVQRDKDGCLCRLNRMHRLSVTT